MIKIAHPGNLVANQKITNGAAYLLTPLIKLLKKEPALILHGNRCVVSKWQEWANVLLWHQPCLQEWLIHSRYPRAPGLKRLQQKSG